MILAMIWMFFIIVLIFIILVRNWQLLKMFPLSKKNVSSISSRVPPSLRASRVPPSLRASRAPSSLRASRVPSSIRASRVPPSLRASRAPPGQQSPQDIFFGGGLPAHGVPWSAMAHGDPRSDMAAWVPWSAVGPGTGTVLEATSPVSMTLEATRDAHPPSPLDVVRCGTRGDLCPHVLWLLSSSALIWSFPFPVHY